MHQLLSDAIPQIFSGKVYLIILHGQILTLLPLFVRHLHEEPTYERLPDIFVVLPLVIVLHRDKVDVVAFHDALQLGANVVGLCKGAGGEVVCPSPIFVMLV